MAKYVEEFTAMTLRELMREKPLDQIKVKDVIERGGINRKTFYYHFHGMEDLLKWMVSKVLDTLPASETTIANWDGQVMALLQLIVRHQVFLQQVTVSRYAPAIRTCVYDRLRRYYVSFVSNAIALYDATGDRRLELSAEEFQYIVNYYLYAVMSVVERWLSNGCGKPCEQLLGILGKLNNYTIFNVLRAFDQNAQPGAH